ncbi:BON domain-containing protein [Entomomonas moraniae]|uniref:BON domain-containing protein n=1 Tax=Entomomonas moraniae TaxID=2213226 RepID=A0A3S9XE04_9GAMM|nr:BON domain-containing protein [Entomomonas moraniae]AZS50560.1 BON domain-containing protein [Entomomonas moraniae]
MNKQFPLIITFLLALIITGCSTVVSTTRDKPVEDNLGKRTWGAQIDDSLIETKVAVNIDKADTKLDDDSRIVVVSYNGVVLLAGQVPNANLKPIAVKAASQGVQGIKQVHDDLQVGPNAGFLARTSDGWITGKVKSSMLFKAGVPSGRIKVVTENGIVYLMGLVTHKEAQAASAVAKDISGVQRVVMVFEYID